jgi:protein-tyrosine phosphatase
MKNEVLREERVFFDKPFNFRDLGGYRSGDGRSVKKGIFYRSGSLGGIEKKEGVGKLEELGLRVVLDFRSRSEAEKEPDPKLSGVDYYNICALLEENGEEMDFSPDDIGEVLTDSGKMVEASEKMLIKMYAGMPFDNPGFRKLFEEMKEEHVPILFHCSAGKDRTGVAAMLVLLLLGVEEKTALDDYELTNEYRKQQIEAAKRVHKKEIEENQEMDMVYTMMEGVVRRAGEMALGKIKERYGSYEAYFEKEFGLNQGDVRRLRDRYLE